MLESILTTSSTGALNIKEFLICAAASLLLGFVIALVYMFKNTYSKGFAVTLVLMPLIVQVVIIMINGNIGTGVAVAGAFSLVRFRSVPGSARDITSIFTAMAAGLAAGSGYITAAALFVIVVAAVNLILSNTSFGNVKNGLRELKITIPENLDYTDVFDDLFQKYLMKNELLQVKTTNMGSLYQLSYHIMLKDGGSEKELLDELRCRNGNLSISLGRVTTCKEEL
jgi:hypothetical protein